MSERIFLGGAPVAGFGALHGTPMEGGSLAACPDIRPDGIYLEGRRVIRLGLDGVGVGDVGDLLAYRQMWDPFITAHYNLWSYVNELLEGVPTAQKCPPGLFDPGAVKDLSTMDQSFCASLRLSRMYLSRTNAYGIPKRWNAWSGTSSADMLINSKVILSDLQGVVMDVGGPYKDELVRIAKAWDIAIELPDVPSFTAQQALIARIEGAMVSTKGVLQIIGYGLGESLKMTGSVTEAVAEGLEETARKLPETLPTPWVWVGITTVVTVVGAGLLIYYVPRRERKTA